MMSVWLDFLCHHFDALRLPWSWSRWLEAMGLNLLKTASSTWPSLSWCWLSLLQLKGHLLGKSICRHTERYSLSLTEDTLNYPTLLCKVMTGLFNQGQHLLLHLGLLDYLWPWGLHSVWLDECSAGEKKIILCCVGISPDAFTTFSQRLFWQYLYHVTCCWWFWCQEKYGIEPTMVVHGVKMLYVPVMPGHSKRLKLTWVHCL